MTEIKAPVDILISRIDRTVRSIRFYLLAGEFLGAGSYALSGYRLMSDGGKQIFEEYPVASPGVASRLASLFSREASILAPIKHASWLSMAVVGAVMIAQLLAYFAVGWVDPWMQYEYSDAFQAVNWMVMAVVLFKGAFTFLNLPYYLILGRLLRDFNEDMSIVSGACNSRSCQTASNNLGANRGS